MSAADGETSERHAPDELLLGSVLSTVLFHIHTNNQYISFTEVQHTVEESLDVLTTYYISNRLRDNPDKIQVTSYHLKNREEKRTLKVK